MTVRTSTLANGMRIITDHMPHVETASLGVWVDVGARHEPVAVNGISHVLEHMAFKGTRRRSARRIAEEIEAVGGHLNAYTSREQTAYYARVLKEDVPLAVDILADILQNSIFDPEELKREQEVIIQEIGQTFDTPDDIIFDYLQETAYPEQAMGRSILGTAERVRGFDRDTVYAYMKDHYKGRKMVLSAAGAIDHDAVVALAEAAFAELPAGDGGSLEKAVYKGGEHREERALEQLHFVLAFPGVAFEDDDFYGLQVFSNLMGGGMSSRLFQTIREERGLCYSIFTFSSSFVDSGIFGVYAGTSGHQINELIDVAAEEFATVMRAVDEEEVARSRAQLKASLLMGLESSSSRCEQLARQLLIFGRPIPTEEIIAKVDAVDHLAVSEVGRRILASGQPSVAALGPVEPLASFTEITSKFA